MNAEVTFRPVNVCLYCSSTFTVDYSGSGGRRDSKCSSNWQHEYARECAACLSRATVCTTEQWGNRETCAGCGGSEYTSIGD